MTRICHSNIPRNKARRKLTKSNRKNLETIKRQVKLDMILMSLYKLPLDIKILIFSKCIQSNMIDWNEQHKREMSECYQELNPISDKSFKIRGNFGDNISYWSYNPIVSQWLYIFNHRSCTNDLLKYKKKVYIHYSIEAERANLHYAEDYGIRDYLRENDWKGYTWYNSKCRCQQCDYVRYLSYKTSILQGISTGDSLCRGIQWNPYQGNGWKIDTK